MVLGHGLPCCHCQLQCRLLTPPQSVDGSCHLIRGSLGINDTIRPAGGVDDDEGARKDRCEVRGIVS